MGHSSSRNSTWRRPILCAEARGLDVPKLKPACPALRRKLYTKSSSPSARLHVASNSNAAPVVIHDLPRQCKTQTVSALPLSRVEGLEDSLQLITGNAWAVIRYRQVHRGVVLSESNADFTTWVESFDCIDDQIGYGL